MVQIDFIYSISNSGSFYNNWFSSNIYDWTFFLDPDQYSTSYFLASAYPPTITLLTFVITFFFET